MDSKTHYKDRPKRRMMALRRHEGKKLQSPSHQSAQRNRLDPGVALTWREREVLVGIASGACDQEIAKKLNMGLSEVEAHIQNIHKKIKAPDRLQVVLWAVAHL